LREVANSGHKALMALAGSVVESVVTSPMAMVITNPRMADNPIEVVNQAFLDLTGYRESEVVGRNCRFLSGGETEPSVREQMRVAIDNARPVLVDVLNYRKDGSPFRNGVMIAPLFDDAGKLDYFLGSQVDLERKDAAALSVRQARATAIVRELPTRQRQVLEMMAKGLLNKQIAYQLGIAEKTVKMHRVLLLERLGGVTTAEAIRIAVEAGF
jgi:PAS domain S-box-containing protein